MKRQPPKPTQPYGFIAFSKLGKAKKHSFRLSDDKQEQQNEVADKFIEGLKRKHRFLGQPTPLEENDYDYLTHEGVGRIVIEVTELSPVDFIGCIVPSSKNTKSLSNSEKIRWFREEKPYGVIQNREYDTALTKKIKNKVDMHYDKPDGSKFWLLVYSTFPYETEYWESGQKGDSEALMLAREYLLRETNPFDEVWFFDLVSNPVRIK